MLRDLFLQRRLTHGRGITESSGSAGTRICRAGPDDRGCQRTDAADDEVGPRTDAQYRNGCASWTPPAGETVGPVNGNRNDFRRVARGRNGAGQELAEPSQRPVEEDGPQRHWRVDDRHAAGSRRHLRAAIDREASATRAGLRRKDSRPVRQGDDDSRHPRDRAGVVRRRGLGHADLGNHRRSRRGSRRVADAADGAGVADRLLRRPGGACPRRQRPRLATHGLRGNWREIWRVTRSCSGCRQRRARGPSLARVPDQFIGKTGRRRNSGGSTCG